MSKTRKKPHTTLEKDINLIVENTDDQQPSKPDLGLIKTRKDRIVASLGKNAELVTVVVQAYNRIEKTRICVNSILKYTKNVEYELILVDNGSTDETLDFFKSVEHPRKKIVHVTKDVGSVVTVMKYVDGRYVAYICNDTYVTQNWIENLLTCLRSDDAIGMVVPATSNASNQQGVDLNFRSLDELYEQAAKYNHSDPRLWHERLRLVVQMAVYKREALDVAGTLLDYGFYHDFSDDDVTFRIRRAGYRTFLCLDTFVCHDHLRTGLSESEVENFNRSIKSGSLDFQSKYFGIDAWEDVNNYERILISMVDPNKHKSSDTLRILGIDVLCGTPILELKNKLRENFIYNVDLSAFTSDPKYWLDLKTICSGEVAADRIEFFDEHFIGNLFDYVLVEKPIEQYSDPLRLIRSIFQKLKPGGVLLLKLSNPLDYMKLFKKIGVDKTEPAEADLILSELTIDALLGLVSQAGFTKPSIVIENWRLNDAQKTEIRNILINNNLSTDVDNTMQALIIREFKLKVFK